MHERNDGSSDRRIIAVGDEIALERLVNLQLIQWQSVQICQRRIAGTKIVEGKTSALLFFAARSTFLADEHGRHDRCIKRSRKAEKNVACNSKYALPFFPAR